MKFSITTLLLGAAPGILAHPSGHAHKAAHRSLDKRVDFVTNQRPDVPAPAASVSQAPTAAPPAASSAVSSTGVQPFCENKSKRATAAQIAYAGNTGGGTGCNLMRVSNLQGYKYGMTVSNRAAVTYYCAAFNKIGPDGGINGFFNGNEAFTFQVAPGESQNIAVDQNSQGGVSCGPNQLPVTAIGLFAGTWVEFDFGNLSNGGWSGADASCLTSVSANAEIPPMSVCAEGVSQSCSVINAGGSGTNAYVAGTNDLDGIGLNLSPGPVRLQVTVG